MVVLLLVISFITFMIFYILPSADPAVLRAGRNPTPELVESIRKTLGLDKPWYVQYWKYLERLVFHFDFGYTYQNNVSVRSQIFDRLPATATLAFGAMVVLAAHRHPDRHPGRPQARDVDRQGRHGHGARGHLGAGLLARPRLALPLLRGHRRSSRSWRAPARTRRAATSSRTPGR